MKQNDSLISFFQTDIIPFHGLSFIETVVTPIQNCLNQNNLSILYAASAVKWRVRIKSGKCEEPKSYKFNNI